MKESLRLFALAVVLYGISAAGESRAGPLVDACGPVLLQRSDGPAIFQQWLREQKSQEEMIALCRSMAAGKPYGSSAQSSSPFGSFSLYPPTLAPASPEPNPETFSPEIVAAARALADSCAPVFSRTPDAGVATLQQWFQNGMTVQDATLRCRQIATGQEAAAPQVPAPPALSGSPQIPNPNSGASGLDVSILNGVWVVGRQLQGDTDRSGIHADNPAVMLMREVGTAEFWEIEIDGNMALVRGAEYDTFQVVARDGKIQLLRPDEIAIALVPQSGKRLTGSWIRKIPGFLDVPDFEEYGVIDMQRDEQSLGNSNVPQHLKDMLDGPRSQWMGVEPADPPGQLMDDEWRRIQCRRDCGTFGNAYQEGGLERIQECEASC